MSLLYIIFIQLSSLFFIFFSAGFSFSLLPFFILCTYYTLLCFICQEVF
nr:MAG TPA: hypothetical protein [Caudoviricetes sp.]